MKELELLYEGKAKQMFLSDNPRQVIVRFKDTATAFNNIKKATIVDKGRVCNAISSLIYQYLERNGVKTHFLERINDTDANNNCIDGNVSVADIKNVTICGGKRLIAAVGVEDLIIVDTDDAVLVCSKNSTQDVKKIIADLRNRGESNLL